MKKIYVAGCGGMLGKAIHDVFEKKYILKCTDKDVNEDWIEYLDFRNFDEYENDVTNFNPDFLFHIGAFTDLEYCETHEDETYFNNAICVEQAVRIANKLDIPIIYISTAGIFDGSKEYFDDWDTPNPMDVYARAKYMGERYVVENAKRYIIFRAGWMMGGGRKKGKKFIEKLIQQIENGNNTLYIVNDREGTPTYTYDFANTLLGVVENEYWGLYNCVCGGMTSRVDVAQYLIRLLGLEDKITIQEVSSDYFKNVYFAPRPQCERLINKKLSILGINKMRDWKVCLQEYIEKEYGDISNN